MTHTGTTAGQQPAFLITIDTEGDNLWAGPRQITTRNARFLPRFQALCERHGLRPVYLTNWEMVRSAEFVEFGRDVLAREAGEIGMHLHAWNSPPLVPLGDDDFSAQPYLIDYPETVQREKIHVLTAELESVFQTKMRSHRAGRWALNGHYAESLAAQGYVVDCSVTPLVVWRPAAQPMDPHAVDYRGFPRHAYRMSGPDISQPAQSGLLEAPMTIDPADDSGLRSAARSGLLLSPLGRRIAGRLLPAVRWLRPNGHNRRGLLDLLDRIHAQGREYAEFMLHSSELMPGGSPLFPAERDIERLYDTLEELFAATAGRFAGRTLSEFHDARPERGLHPGMLQREIA